MGYAVDFDGQLYNGLSIGKAEAFASVFDRYHRLLYALAYRYLKSGPEAEDAVQATVCRRKTAVFVPGLLHSQRCRSESDAAIAQERVSGYKDLAGILLRK